MSERDGAGSCQACGHHHGAYDFRGDRLCAECMGQIRPDAMGGRDEAGPAPVCPFCGHADECSGFDLVIDSALEDGDVTIADCSECGQRFTVTAYVTYTFTARKPAVDNG